MWKICDGVEHFLGDFNARQRNYIMFTSFHSLASSPYIYITYIFTYYNAPSFPLALFSRTPRFTIFPSIYLSIYHHHHHHHPAIFSTGPWSNPPPHNFIFLVLALTQFSFTLFFQHVYCFILYFIISHFMFLFFVNSYI